MRAFAFVNGVVFSSFNPLRIVSGFTVVDEKIVYVGDSEKAWRIARELGGEKVDLNKKIVLPGFIDAHMHFDSLGISLKTLDLRKTKSIEELKTEISSYLNQNPNTKVLVARGWDQENFKEKRWPTRWDIDSVTGDVPAILTRVCGHAALLNTTALSILKEEIDKLPENFVVRDEKGRETGIILEDLVYKAWDILTKNIDLKEYMVHATRYAAENGVTSVGFMSVSLEAFKSLQEISYEGLLRTRVHMYFDSQLQDKIIGWGFRKGYGSPFLVINGVKFFVDGSLGARTAFLSEDYSDEKGNKGKALIDEDTLTKKLEETVKNGLQPAVHAIGDAALDIALKALKRAHAWETGGRIEHASVIRPDQMDFISKYNITVVVQPHFVVSDWWVLQRLGEKRLKWIYPFKTMIDHGIKISFSTDAPIEPLNPWKTIKASIARRETLNPIEMQHHQQESLTIEQALDSYTRVSAKALERSDLGVLDVGYYADFVIIDRNPLTLKVDEIDKVNILETYVGGIRVY